ncbi:MAG: SCO family protein [Deltaproteobacteria bacterium]|nr:SCO family protein [Deltaproteobacteria bacterium]
MPSFKNISLSVCAAVVLFAYALPLRAVDNGADSLAGDNAIGSKPPDATLTNSDSKPFSVKDYGAGRPLVISYVYTSCPHTCPPILKSLKRAFEEMEPPGDRFAALTVSFDPENDTPKVLKEHSDSFGGSENWRFATANAETIKKFCDSRGFYFEKTGDGFVHTNMITVVDGNGVIIRQLYGVNFKPEEIIGAVNDSILGISRAGGELGVVDRIKLIIFKYDIGNKRLTIDYLRVFTLGFVLLLPVAAAWFLIRRRFSDKS